jgi:hypothetical protein
MADNLVNDDRDNPPIAGEINRLLNRYPAPGQSAAAIPNPTTQAGKINPHDGQGGYSYTEKLNPGKRLNNPLSNFSSYTYKISLYMVPPDVYNAFVKSGRTNLFSNTNFSPSAFNRDINITEVPSSAAIPTVVGTPYLVAQSGGINDTDPTSRAPGLDLDFYIDNLNIKQAIATPETQTSTNVTEFSFDIIEPYGFSLLSKLRAASDHLQEPRHSTSPDYAKLLNDSRNLFVLGIQFLGYDKDGNVIDPGKIPSVDGNPQGNAFGLYQRYYDIMITDLKFKLDGKPVVYNIKAATVSYEHAYATKRGVVWSGATVSGITVRDALLGGSKIAISNNSTANERSRSQGGQAEAIGLLTKLNNDQQILFDNKDIERKTIYDVVFLGEASKIADATLMSKANPDKRFWGQSSASKTSEVNVSTEQKNSLPKDTVRQVSLGKGISILQAINEIIKQSTYLEQSLSDVLNASKEPDKQTKSPNSQPNSDKTVFPIKWYNCQAEVINLGWDNKQKDFVYSITYIIQLYATPAVASSYAGLTSQYLGPDKRYEYWFTGKNSEVISYSQEFNNSFYTVTLGGFDNPDAASGGPADIPVIPGQPQNQSKTGKLNQGNEAQNSYMSSLYDPYSWSSTKLQILGDPDFLMQTDQNSSIALYNPLYGNDGYTINPNGRQVFVELNFNEAVDYNNKEGLLSVNNSVYFYKYPNYIAEPLNRRGGGIILQVLYVQNIFNKGKFEQTLTCFASIFSESTSSIAAAQADALKRTTVPVVNNNTTGGGGAATSDNRGAFQNTTSDQLLSSPNSSGSASSGKVLQSNPMQGATNATTISPVRGGSSPVQNKTGTRPTKGGPVQDDERGDLTNYNLF